ncbi:MAG: ornithine cyclodeaminase family protein [Rhodospirillales bacterium]|jgi:alanine dehydrogenase|nr:ornithine cyclodeaminase family protein [Rhodospirillales bacterium]MBT4006713.1 ornithine cyclodeaminase family protein [Rhodospirillales bacterium]MBT5113991.1 ornithine cyclodeaminase family protein [Rhodospirillales bacterium]MBT5672519.1 ornithine cyclodeaminase family protein [Rhodospirillales bacterium]MBT6185812.1 ornithine cyclodeaminase family protein [Rhodospirillales bacterium]
MTLFINEKHVAQLIDEGHATMGDFVAAIEGAFIDQGNGDFDILPRQNFEVPIPGRAKGGSLKIGGAALKGVGAMGASLYSGGYGGMNLWITLYDTTTGKVPAILHGSCIGQMKTGSTSAMAANHMARKDATRVGILGSGDQARTQLMGLCAIRDITTVRAYSTTRENLESYIAWAKGAFPDLDIEAADTAEDAIRDADIFVTITNAADPIMKADWIKPGAHGSIVGAHYPKKREIDAATLNNARVIVDDLEQAFNEKGELLIPLESGEITRDIVQGTIGDVLVGKIKGRESEDQITLFLSGGTALEYIAVANMLHKKAVKAGIGQVLDYEENR